ncbi:MAG TPA: response regulator [Oligoflexus sp.]|uniref:hybrid sensor histidine kinase/response regulator n=1 Tax=Oligoflexus sp. TaxID=1971216 RepID=UPI002D2B1C94|nr:response regulator [Oligoflexus sp.]HYX40039.1 response regulator [Oligoflexus sp.]
MKDIKQKLLAAFDVEHREHLAQIRAFLAAVEPGTTGESNAVKVGIAEAFCSAHSLKGASRVVDLKSVMELAHRLETLFHQIQTGKLSVSKDLQLIVSRSLDLIEDIVTASRSNLEQPGSIDLLQALDQLVEGKLISSISPSGSVQPAPSSKIPPEAVNSPQLVIAGSETSRPAAPTLVVPASTRAPARTNSHSFDTMRLSAEHFDRLIKTAGEVISFSRNQEENAFHFKEMSQVVSNIEKEWGIIQKNSAKYLRQSTKDSDKSKLVKYLSFIETQVRALGRQLRAASADQKNDNFTLRRLGEQLQEEVQTARLMPAADIFESFSKMMRDLAKDEQKEIEFRMIGMDIEADRVVLQALKDPLMHTLRNALSHGIESASQRALLKKPISGRISLSLEAASRRLALIVADDGQGLNIDSIRSKALEAGLIDAQKIDEISDEELRQLVFHPGFSTAKQITEISGRGVGLSIVKDAIERLQGEVVVESTPGQGCRFKFSVPLSVSTHRLLLMQCQGQTLAIPTHAVQCVQRERSNELTSVEGRPVIKVKGIYIPVMALSRLLGMQDGSVKSNDNALAFAVIKFGEKRLALAVDGLLGEREGLIKDLGPPLSRSNRFAGGLLIDRAAIALVLNPPALFEAYHQLRHGQPLEIAQRKMEQQKLRILVVDDSFTTRILEKSILEAKGYHVDIAIDGVEALAFLSNHQVDLIISDVEMPRMDGLTLLQQLKADPRLSKTPVIIVSSRDRREDQERGLKLGAEAYLPKQEFNQKILLDTIRQVI